VDTIIVVKNKKMSNENCILSFIRFGTKEQQLIGSAFRFVIKNLMILLFIPFLLPWFLFTMVLPLKRGIPIQTF